MAITKLTMIRPLSPAALVPYGDVAWEIFDALPRNKPLIISVHLARNPEHLNKFWALAARVANFHRTFLDAADAVRWAKIKLRMFHKWSMPDGTPVVELESIAVESMEQVAFNEFYDKCLALWCLEIGCDPEELER